MAKIGPQPSPRMAKRIAGKRVRPNRGQRKQAPALSQRIWRAWLQWLLGAAGPRIYFATCLTGAFGLRGGEAVALKKENIQIDRAIPRITVTAQDLGSRKSPGDVYIRRHHLVTLKAILRDGIVTTVAKGHKHGKGELKRVATWTKWKVPCTGYIFRARTNSKTPHLTYHAIWSAIKKQTRPFLAHLKATKQCDAEEVLGLTPHSGRATLITELMGQGVSTAMSMKYARHAKDSYRVHIAYGRLTLDDVKVEMDRKATPTKKTKWHQYSTKTLLEMQASIAKELAKRC